MTLRKALRTGVVSRTLVDGWVLANEGYTEGVGKHFKRVRNFTVFLFVFCLSTFATGLLFFFYPNKTGEVSMLIGFGLCALIFFLSLVHHIVMERALVQDLRSLYEHLNFDFDHEGRHPFDPDDLFESTVHEPLGVFKSSIEDRVTEIVVAVLLSEYLLQRNGSSEPVSLDEVNRRYRLRRARAVNMARLSELRCLLGRFGLGQLVGVDQSVFDRARYVIGELDSLNKPLAQSALAMDAR